MNIREVDDYLDALGSEHVDPKQMGSGDGAKAIAVALGMTEEEQEELWQVCLHDIRDELSEGTPPEIRALCSMYMHVGFLMGSKWEMERNND